MEKEEHYVDQRLPPLLVGSFLICLAPPPTGAGADPILNSVPPEDGAAGAPPKGEGGCCGLPPKENALELEAGGGRLELGAAGDDG